MLVVAVIILIHFVVVIFSLRMYAQQVFSALFTGVLNTIACGVSGVFPAGPAGNHTCLMVGCHNNFSTASPQRDYMSQSTLSQ